MEIVVPKEGITALFDKLSEKIFNENPAGTQLKLFEVRFNKKICQHLRNVVYCGLLSRENDHKEQTMPVEKDDEFTVKDKLCVVVYNLKLMGLIHKANKLENLVSKIDFSSRKQSVYSGHLDVLNEVEAILKVLLALSSDAKLMTPDVCEVWRKENSSFQLLKPYQSDPYHVPHGKYPRIEHGNPLNLDYQYFPSELFETVPCFGVSKKAFENETISLDVDMFIQEPGLCGLIKWFGAQRNEDSFTKETKRTIFNALVHSHTSDVEVKLSLPDLPLHPRFNGKPSETTLISEDEGFAEILEECESSTISGLSDDSGIHGLKIWDEALNQKPSHFHTWEGRKQIISAGCKPFFTEAGPEMVDFLIDMRITEASYLLNCPPTTFKYLQMVELIRDGLMVLIGVPSQTFQLDKTTGSFLVSPIIRISGCSPDSLHLTLKNLAEIGTNYFHLDNFTTCQKHSTLIQSSVLRAFISALRMYLQEYQQSVVIVEASNVQSVLDLCIKFRKEAYKLKFLADICMCSGFTAESRKSKPKFPIGVKLLSYLYQLCLINTSSPVANLLQFLLKVSCTPYLRFLQQWVFKGKCIDVYKEFMIHQNDVYLASRDKYYWTNGYVMAGASKMENVPVFLKDLADDMFTCGKSINLLKLCFPEHYICNHHVSVPVMNVAYSLNSLKAICDSSQHYSNEIRKLEEKKRKDWERKKSEEKSKRKQALINERQKASKALAEMRELLKKAKEAMAEKKKEELDFLKQQMEDALNKKILDAQKADEVDAQVARNLSQYEVTTARLEEQLKEEAREELVRYYEELTRETERREHRAMWLLRRRALKHKREKFLEEEENMLAEMRKEVPVNNKLMDVGPPLENIVKDERAAAVSTRKQWVITKDKVSSKVINEDDGDGVSTNHPSHSTIQDLIYTSTDGREILDGKLVESSEHIETVVAISDKHPTDSTVQSLIYPDTEGGKWTNAKETRASSSVLRNSTGNNFTTRSTRAGEQPSTIEGLLYPGEDNDSGATPSSRGAGPQSTIESLLYPGDDNDSGATPSSRGIRHESTIGGLLYPAGDISWTKTSSTRGQEPPSTIQDILYPDSVNEVSRITSTRGSEPPSTIQKLLYPTPRVTQVRITEVQEQKRQPTTYEDVWLATQFDPLPDNFDILDQEPFGDIFLRVIQDGTGFVDDFHSSYVNVDDLESENDACKVLCLPVILQRCVMEPLTAQINVVNSAIVRYFMDDLRLIEHFETLKKFLLMEDGEFSFSLTRQLFEKVSSGISPQQLCCISTLNSIMTHAIQSSVYACQSDNTRSLSFVLKSVPDIFKRNDIGVFDFVELRYKIQWPVNIVITENSITKYNRIFAFMLRLKRTAWTLQDIRYSLKRVDKMANNSPQLRKIHLFRHEMNHFVNEVQGYISNQILHVTWQEFIQSLEHNVRNLDDLHDYHAEYLNKALFRALLNKKAAPVMKIISDLLTMVLKFHTQLVSSSWFTDLASGHLVHPAFSLLCSTHEKFKESTCFLFTVISKLVIRGYQPHLEELLLRLDFNSYYGTKDSGKNVYL